MESAILAGSSDNGSGSRDEELGVGAAFLVDGIVYALVGGAAGVQLVRNCCRYRPWTVQKMIHLLMFFATLVRSVFLALVGSDWCDVLSGKVSESKCSMGERDLFYILDQLPILAFFATYALLVQFWAEVYYNAVDNLPTLTGVIKPAIRWFLVIVLLIQGLFWIFYASVWRNERAFFTRSQAILNMELFLIIATGFIYFGRKAYIELRSVPVELGIRSRKLKELTIMTTVGTSCFMARCGLQIYLSTEKKQLHDQSTWFVVVVYYALLEIVPALSVLYFNRRLPPRRRPGGLSATSSPIRGGTLFFGKGMGADNTSNADPLRKSLLRG
ncbi:Tobamovirus multiplication protein 3 [Phytophthora citrophthora]|uniref:Tobamovirus multiplication protein 3 n=1 Tax=Phytophthora citrophthora TaxID=4793 RepID=A0AAD9LS90_9STRA|nr:Tobamovirus multiplication protein 3 [Phytophthora citrophthora]